MADFKTPGLGIGLEFERNDIYEGNNFSEGPPDPKRDAQVIRVQFDIVFSLNNKGNVFFRNIYFFGTALKSGLVETVPTRPVATSLSIHTYTPAGVVADMQALQLHCS